MRTILLIVSFLIIIFTSILFYIGIYDEIYQDFEKNKLWFSDGSFSKSLICLLVSIFCSIYIFRHFSQKIKNKGAPYGEKTRGRSDERNPSQKFSFLRECLCSLSLSLSLRTTTSTREDVGLRSVA